MMLRIITALFIITGLAFVATKSSAQSQYGPVSGDAARGKDLYYDYACYACHGYTGIGRQNLANDVSGIMVNEQVFLTYLRARASVNPDVPSQSMPNYPSESLSDDEAIDIYAYIRTFRDDPPGVEDIPSLNSILEAAESR